MENTRLTDDSVKIFFGPVEVMLKIGICDYEQDTPQRVSATAAVYTDPAYLQKISADTIIDYALFYREIKTWERRSQVGLIEDYLNELLTLCFSDERVTACEASIRKLDVFGRGQGAGVEAFMSRAVWSGLR